MRWSEGAAGIAGISLGTCTQQLTETTEADRVGGLRNGSPQCRSHSRLSKGEQTFNIFGVNTHTHLCCLRAAPAFARRVKNRPAACTRRRCAISSPVPRPSDTSRRVGPAVVQVAPNLTLEQCRDPLRPRRAFTQQPPPASLPHTPRLGLILCAPSESVKFEIFLRQIQFVQLRLIPSWNIIIIIDSRRNRVSFCPLFMFSDFEFPECVVLVSKACHCVHVFPSDLAAFNGGMTKYASRSEDHWIDVCAAHEPELVLPRQVTRQATSSDPGGLQGSWFPASLTRKTYEDQDLGWHIVTAALPCPCCPDRSCSTTGRGSTRPVPVPSLTAGVADPEGGHTSPRTKPTHPRPLFPFRGFLALESLTQCARGGTHPFRGLPEPVIHHKGTNPRTGRGVSQRHPGVPSQLPNIYSSGTNPRTGHWTACLCPVKDVADVTVEPPHENRERGKGEFSFCRPVALPSRNSQLRRCPV